MAVRMQKYMVLATQCICMRRSKELVVRTAPDCVERDRFYTFAHVLITLGQSSEGTYGDVYCGVHKQDKTVVALKRILMHNEK